MLMPASTCSSTSTSSISSLLATLMIISCGKSVTRSGNDDGILCFRESRQNWSHTASLRNKKKRRCQIRSGETGSEPLSETYSLIFVQVLLIIPIVKSFKLISQTELPIVYLVVSLS
jgi:hypothetical protein